MGAAASNKTNRPSNYSAYIDNRFRTACQRGVRSGNKFCTDLGRHGGRNNKCNETGPGKHIGLLGTSVRDIGSRVMPRKWCIKSFWPNGYGQARYRASPGRSGWPSALNPSCKATVPCGVFVLVKSACGLRVRSMSDQFLAPANYHTLFNPKGFLSRKWVSGFFRLR